MFVRMVSVPARTAVLELACGGNSLFRMLYGVEEVDQNSQCPLHPCLLISRDPVECSCEDVSLLIGRHT
nr:hypothetical protein [Tanacetum cinerariifolium]